MKAPAGPTRRPLAALAAAVALVLAATACGTGSGPGAPADGRTERVTSLTALDYYTDTTEHAHWGELLTRCGEKAGVTVEHRSVPAPSLVPTALRQASAGTLPDLLMLDNPDLQQFARSGALAPLRAHGVRTDGFGAGILSAGTYRGEVYGLAPTVNTLALFYDKRALAEAGVPVPRTWGELRKAARATTRPGRYGLAVDADASFEATFQFLPFLWSNGGDERRLDGPRAVEALGLWTGLVRDGSVSRSVLTWNQADVHEQFLGGRAAMMVNGPWRIPALDAARDLDWGVVPLPVPRAGDALVTPLGGEVWTVPRNDSEARRRKAAEVLACLNEPASMLALAGWHHTVPSRPDVADRYAARVPSMAAFVRSVEGARARTRALGPAWPRTAAAIHTAVQAAVSGQRTPEEALRRAQRTATGS
ncbi:MULTISPECIES: extracellular solute-binding protein [unclassified Streptomyces]|uniref:sugar ABC transporter substrate-binding protein n=1 Tax=unclassified Streptomyces TaxID=2593676 RepID=UPI0033BC93FC